jgi:hypothetical protein
MDPDENRRGMNCSKGMRCPDCSVSLGLRHIFNSAICRHLQTFDEFLAQAQISVVDLRQGILGSINSQRKS